MSEEQLTAESAKGLGSERPGGLLSAIGYAPGRIVAGLLTLLFAGALFWTTGRDPFRRIWFSVKVPGQGKAPCVVVLPRSNPKSKIQNPNSDGWPVVVYLHGSGGSLLADGNELRQMAEMGMAVVGMDYNQKAENGKQKAEIETRSARAAEEGAQDSFDEHFGALLSYLGRQPWADTNRMAWIGSSLGAQRVLSFALHHPAVQPKLLVLLAGAGSSSELSTINSQLSTLKSQPSTLNSQPSTSVLLFHGERDEVFPLSEARRVAACLGTNGVAVELRVLPGEGHDLGADRLLVFRVIGEQCLTRLEGPDALANHRSILSWQAQAKPLWLFWTPALAWAVLWLRLRRKVGQASRQPPEEPPSASDPATGERPGALPSHPAPCPLTMNLPKRAPLPALSPQGGERVAEGRERGDFGEEGEPAVGSRGRSPSRGAGGTPAVRWVAAVLAAAALAETALHVVPPRLPVSERTLSIARRHLVAPKEISDFEFLAAKPCWAGKRLRTLLDHVELAHYNRELINWKLNDQTYREFVLSAQIDPAADGALNWRRSLWENFYPRIRREQDPQAAAEIVVRFLRERVTVAQGSNLPSTVAEIWQRQITNARGFETVYVAALRSVGVPSRLDAQGRAELWSVSAWKAAPRPLLEAWN